METPLPSRRITRSQALAAKDEESRNKKNQEREKSALIDITNGSPIIGLAMGSLKTPSSRCSKKRMMNLTRESMKNMTPGSGESLLRGQVKTLLQKVEEEEEGLVSKICFEHNSWYGYNKPQVCAFSTSGNNGLNLFTQMLNEVISAPNQEDKVESVEKDVVTRSLLMDFSEKSRDSGSSDCNALLTSQDSNSSASLWSVQVNASTSEEYNKGDCEDVVVDELCEGMSKISVNNVVKFTGKHTRFVYNSDGELKGELSSLSSKIE
ncbi:hypothetical protein L1987_52292 [Smallanthus sonchifolius]|uniref:Uncharacterized protein n=1 Tax=Smallanthus sonchifolius TaxID=185202 RepID=A0ACB9ETB8_9ASTR|nr:hypothetical protein L1987_52292 [Smallanthus sonchifolius]